MKKCNRIAGAAGVLFVALMAASVPLKSASAENDRWGHRNWDNDWNSGGGFYYNTGPSYYYSPPPTYYYYPAPTYYYYPPTYYGPSFGFSVRIR